MKKLLRTLLPLLTLLAIGCMLLAACGSAKAKITIDYNGAVLDGQTEQVLETETSADLNALIADANITLTRDGYTFDGWDIPAFEDGKLPAEVTVRAKWKAVIYNIVYDYNGGALETGATNPATYTIEDAVTFATPVREGYTFLGYFAGNDTQTAVTALPKGSKGDVSLTARWAEIAVTVNVYRIGAQEPVKSQVFAYGEEVVPSVDLGENSPLAIAAYLNEDYSIFEPFTVAESGTVTIYLDVYTKGMTFTKKAAADIAEGTYHSTVEFSEEFYAAKMMTRDLPQVDDAAVTEVIFPNYYTEDGVTLPVELTEQGQSSTSALTAETVYLSANIKVIGKDTFNNNKNLANVVFDTKLNKFKEVGVLAFNSTPSLQQITLPSTTEYLANGAFQASALTSFRFPKAMKEIAYQCFLNCADLETVDFEEDCVLETVGYSAFSNNSTTDVSVLASVSFPSTLKVLGDTKGRPTEFTKRGAIINGIDESVLGFFSYGVFYSKIENNTALTVNFNGAKLETVGDFIFFNRTGLKNVNIEVAENGVVGTGVFSRAGNPQTEITLSLGANAYVWQSFMMDCWAKSIAFEGLTEMPELAAYKSNPSYDSTVKDKNVLSESVLRTITNFKNYPMFFGCVNLQTVTFDRALQTIGAYSFSYCTAQPKFDAATAANVEIGEKAFYGSLLSSFDFQGTPFEAKKAVPASCFENSANLATLTNYDNIETFGAAAFKDTAVTAFQIARNMTIAGNTFAGAPTKITVAKGARNYAMIGADGAETSDEASAEYLVGKTGDDYTYIAYDYKLNAETPVTERTIPASIKAIGGYYTGNGVLTKITLNAAMTQIAAGEFEGCSALNTVVLSAETTAIGDNAFKDCTSLQSVNFADTTKLESIGAYAFANTNLSSFTAPATLKTLGNRAFNGTNSLTSVVLSAATLLETVSEYAFTTAAAANLTTVVLPQNGALTTIGSYAFRYAKITTLQIPATVKTLGAYSFGNCTELLTVTIGSTTADSLLGSDDGAMDKNAFNTCSALQSVTIYGNDQFVSEGGILYNQIAGDNGTFSYTLAVVPAKLSGDITLKAGLTEITTAFQNTNISSIIIPASVTNISSSAFNGCANLQSVSIGENDKYVSEGGILYNKVAGSNGAFSYTLAAVPAKLSGDVTLKAGLTTVAALFKNTEITSIVIPESVKSIAASAFSGCKQLATVVIKGNLTASTSNLIFTGCANLSSVTYLGTTKLTYMNKILTNSTSAAITLTVKEPSQYTGLDAKITVVQYEEPAQSDEQ